MKNSVKISFLICLFVAITCIAQTKLKEEINLENKSMSKIPFQTIDWKKIPKTEHKGETGTSFWQTMQLEGLRVRIVEYSKGYLADHWCQKGHIVYCLEGGFTSELGNGETFF